MILTLTLTWPAGMPGIVVLAQCGFLTTVNDAFGTMFVIMYGPTPGGGLVGSFLNGVPVGIEPERREREHVVERAVRRDQVDRDLAGGVVGRDAGDRLGLAVRVRGARRR